MNKIGNAIVKARYVLLTLFAILVAVSAIFMTKVKINYDMTKYLDKDSSSSLSLEIMQDEFGSVGQCQVMVHAKDFTFEDATILKKKLDNVSGVASIIFAEESSDSNYYKTINGESYAIYKVFLTTGNFDKETYDTLDNIRDAISEYNNENTKIKSELNGGAVSNEFLTNALDKDMAIILIIVAVVVLVILTIVSSSWIEPLIFAIIVGGAILINLGSNILLNHISYIGNSMSFITKSIAAVMQLALSMDYAIVLLHSYKEQKSLCDNNNEAMAKAIAKSLAPVSSSSLTTVAGLVALMFMSFSIGFDVGLVLAKGIIISLLCVFLFMPSLLLIFDKLLVKTSHKSINEILIHKNEKRIAKFQKQGRKATTFAGFQKKTKYLIPAIATLLIIVGAALNFNSKYSFVLEASTDNNATVNIDNKKITDTFGTQNTLVVLLDKENYSYSQEMKLINYMDNYEYKGEKIINSKQGLTTYGVNIPLTASEMSAIFSSKGIPLNENIVTNLYDIMKSYNIIFSEKATLEQVINFLNTGVNNIDGITLLCSEIEKNLDTSYKQIQSLGLYTTEDIYNPDAPIIMQYQQLTQGHDNGILTKEQEEQYQKLTPLFTTLSLKQIVDTYPFIPQSVAQELTKNGDQYNYVVVASASINNIPTLFAESVNDKYANTINAYSLNIKEAYKSLTSDNYIRVIFNMNMPISGDDSFNAINELTDELYDNEDYKGIQIVSETFVYSQIKDVYNNDIVIVNLISFFSILLIIAITFKSYFIPILLTVLIQGAIWVTMGISTIFGQEIFFICYIVVMCVQMGATIDYAILLTTNYKQNRKTMNHINAMGKAMNSSLMTIFTSGSILILATLIIGLVSKVKIISDLGLLLSRGCAISVFAIILCLPQFLILFDKVIEKTTWKTKFYNNSSMEFDEITINENAILESKKQDDSTNNI